jgi:hypothetical protein
MKNILRTAIVGVVFVIATVFNANAQEPVSESKMKHAENLAFSSPMKSKNKSLTRRDKMAKKTPKKGESTKNFVKGKNPDATSRKMKKRAKGQK